ncbi:MAG: tRNA-dihydrouridine synthase [Candidatus Heimdallarchaeum aukensis]|uniref:tRNA-dihydrouridine synthase n=1 Tax=Candidatus Heimdallarchaeum aukensis TaxID=2876573 RepID=A0A9Y1BNC3_9ARCH|nr:MAG: tRNA-dihydrouridine synthase [Candidatus Heimdallarchaeum aukensis]
MEISPPIIQSALAGYTTPSFIQSILDNGAGMATFGGYSLDKLTNEGSTEIIKRNRKEILLPRDETEFQKWCNLNLNVKKSSDKQLIAINLRISKIDQETLRKINFLSNFIDIIELNAHCRQKEIVERRGGEYLLKDINHLDYILEKIRKTSPNDKKIGIKIRGYIVKDQQKLVNVLESRSVDYLHIDCMEPGKPYANLKILKSFSELTDITLIGNNSVRNVKDVQQMIDAGASAVSIARPLITNPSSIKRLISECKNKGILK